MQDGSPPQPAPSTADNFMSTAIELTPSERHALLTPSERHVFESFLTTSAIDETDWLQTNIGYPFSPPSVNTSLAKATKELIALHPPPKIPAPQAYNQSEPQQPSSSTTNHQTIAPAQSQRQPQWNTQHRPLAKRPRRSSSPIAPPHAQLQSQSHAHPPPLPPSKPALLTAQQKKANHIQSEQKRRANIRRGYEALCETIPALREAIRAEEVASNNGTPSTGGGSGDASNGGGSSGNGSGSGRKRRSKDDGGEKADGRAGPRSESVVLQKTIEYIQGLLGEKAALASRLEDVCSLLGPGHPALHPNASFPPLWEREWDGGQGLMVDANGEVFRDSDEE